MGDTNENRSKRKHQKNPCHMPRILSDGIEYQILCQNRRTLSGRGDRSGTFNTKSSGHVLHITIPYTIVNILLNAIPVYIGFRFIGKKFTSIPV